MKLTLKYLVDVKISCLQPDFVQAVHTISAVSLHSLFSVSPCTVTLQPEKHKKQQFLWLYNSDLWGHASKISQRWRRNQIYMLTQISSKQVFLSTCKVHVCGLHIWKFVAASSSHSNNVVLFPFYFFYITVYPPPLINVLYICDPW